MIWSRNLSVNLIAFLLTVLVVILMRPYFTWQAPDYIMPLVSVAITAIVLPHISFRHNKNIDLLLLLVMAYLLLSFLRGAHIGGTLINLSFAFLPFMRKDFLMNVYEKFRYIIIILFTLSAVSYVTVLTGLQSPIGMIEPLNELKQMQYAHYLFLVLPAKLDGFARYCSCFDEPGVVGTMSALMLFVEGFSFKKKGNYIILLNGLLSLSLFFYMAVAIYLLFKLPLKYKLAFVLGVAVLYATTINNEIIKVAIWDRLTLNEEGELSGDNRNSDELMAVWDQSKYNVQILTGYGESFIKDYEGSASIQLFILRDGLIFVLMYFAVYLLYAKRMMQKRSELFLFALILFVTLYQRPGFCGIEFTLLFAAYIISKSKTNVSINSSSNLQLGRVS